MTDRIYTWFDIKPTPKELERLVNRGTKNDDKWYLDGKFVGTAKTNALRALKRKLFAEYVDKQKREK